jgi:hypothetical protein
MGYPISKELKNAKLRVQRKILKEAEDRDIITELPEIAGIGVIAIQHWNSRPAQMSLNDLQGVLHEVKNYAVTAQPAPPLTEKADPFHIYFVPEELHQRIHSKSYDGGKTGTPGGWQNTMIALQKCIRFERAGASQLSGIDDAIANLEALKAAMEDE